MFLFYKLITEEFGQEIAQKTLINLLIFPTSFYFLVVYSEGFYFLLVILTFYLYRQKKFKTSVFITILASLTRISGVALGLAVVVTFFAERGIRAKNLFILFALSGLVIFWGYLFVKTDEPYYFFNLQTKWSREISFPWISFKNYIESIFTPVVLKANLNLIFDLLFSIFALGLALRSIRFLPRIYSLYAIFAVIFPIMTSTLLSMPRFALMAFPIFITLSFVKNQKIIITYRLISLLLLIYFTSRFINGYWVS